MPESKTPRPLPLIGRWWFLPAFLVSGQVLMRTTGYTAWAAQAGQEFMLSVLFYMALLGPVLAGVCLVVLQRLSQPGARES